MSSNRGAPPNRDRIPPIFRRLAPAVCILNVARPALTSSIRSSNPDPGAHSGRRLTPAPAPGPSVRTTVVQLDAFYATVAIAQKRLWLRRSETPCVIAIEGLKGTGKSLLIRHLSDPNGRYLLLGGSIPITCTSSPPPGPALDVRDLFDSWTDDAVTSAYYSVCSYLLQDALRHENNDAFEGPHIVLVNCFHASAVAQTLAWSCSPAKGSGQYVREELPRRLFDWPMDLEAPVFTVVLHLPEPKRRAHIAPAREQGRQVGTPGGRREKRRSGRGARSGRSAWRAGKSAAGSNDTTTESENLWDKRLMKNEKLSERANAALLRMTCDQLITVVEVSKSGKAVAEDIKKKLDMLIAAHFHPCGRYPMDPLLGLRWCINNYIPRRINIDTLALLRSPKGRSGDGGGEEGAKANVIATSDVDNSLSWHVSVEPYNPELNTAPAIVHALHDDGRMDIAIVSMDDSYAHIIHGSMCIVGLTGMYQWKAVGDLCSREVTPSGLNVSFYVHNISASVCIQNNDDLSASWNLREEPEPLDLSRPSPISATNTIVPTIVAPRPKLSDDIIEPPASCEPATVVPPVPSSSDDGIRSSTATPVGHVQPPKCLSKATSVQPHNIPVSSRPLPDEVAAPLPSKNIESAVSSSSKSSSLVNPSTCPPVNVAISLSSPHSVRLRPSKDIGEPQLPPRSKSEVFLDPATAADILVPHTLDSDSFDKLRPSAACTNNLVHHPSRSEADLAVTPPLPSSDILSVQTVGPANVEISVPSPPAERPHTPSPETVDAPLFSPAKDKIAAARGKERDCAMEPISSSLGITVVRHAVSMTNSAITLRSSSHQNILEKRIIPTRSDISLTPSLTVVDPLPPPPSPLCAIKQKSPPSESHGNREKQRATPYTSELPPSSTEPDTPSTPVRPSVSLAKPPSREVATVAISVGPVDAHATVAANHDEHDTATDRVTQADAADSSTLNFTEGQSTTDISADITVTDQATDNKTMALGAIAQTGPQFADGTTDTEVKDYVSSVSIKHARARLHKQAMWAPITPCKPSKVHVRMMYWGSNSRERRSRMTIVMTGAPGCGKGTIGMEVARLLNWKFHKSLSHSTKSDNGIAHARSLTEAVFHGSIGDGNSEGQRAEGGGGEGGLSDMEQIELEWKNTRDVWEITLLHEEQMRDVDGRGVDDEEIDKTIASLSDTHKVSICSGYDRVVATWHLGNFAWTSRVYPATATVHSLVAAAESLAATSLGSLATRTHDVGDESNNWKGSGDCGGETGDAGDGEDTDDDSASTVDGNEDRNRSEWKDLCKENERLLWERVRMLIMREARTRVVLHVHLRTRFETCVRRNRMRKCKEGAEDGVRVGSLSGPEETRETQRKERNKQFDRGSDTGDKMNEARRVHEALDAFVGDELLGKRVVLGGFWDTTLELQNNEDGPDAVRKIADQVMAFARSQSWRCYA